jgi:pyridoxine 5-phosphate synthase
MSAAGIEVSLFIAPAINQIEAAARVGAEFVELHTGAFAENFADSARGPADGVDARPTSDLPELERLVAGAKHAHGLGLRVNAGHGLNYENLYLLRQVPHLVELNIGHSIVSRAVTVGLGEAVREMLGLMRGYGEGER